jgi:hypothetical protein
MIIDVLAGKMHFDGKKVSADNRKGILRLVIDETPSIDTVVKLLWLDRSQDPPIVENEWSAPVVIEQVPSAKTGKVYVIRTPNEEKQFIWIQQQSSDAVGDAAGYSSGTSIDSVDALMNQIQMFSQIPSCHDALEMYSQIFGHPDDHVGHDQMLVDLGHHEDEDVDEEQLENIMEQMFSQIESSDNEEDQIVGLLLMNPEILGACMANLLGALAQFVASGRVSGAQSTTANDQSQHTAVIATPVESVITSPESIAALVTDSESVSRLLALCPEGETDVREILKSPQFTESLRALTEGIYSDQISVLFTSLGLAPPEGNVSDPFEALCEALEKKFTK